MPRQLFNHFPWEECDFATPDCEATVAQRAGNACAQVTLWEDHAGYGVEVTSPLFRSLVSYDTEEKGALKEAEDYIRRQLSDVVVMMRVAKVPLD